jgi:carboxypeptidase family protein
MKRILISFASASVLFLVACGGSKERAPKEEAAAPPAATATIDEATAATITGKVSFSGTKPSAKTIDMSATPACSRAHAGAPQKSEEVVVNGNGTLKNVFVWVKAGVPDKQWPIPATPVELTQKGCMYGPHVIGVMANQKLKITNDDPTNHNIHPLPKINQEWNQSQPPKGDSLEKSFAREEVMIPVKCNVHPWMRSYIGVVNHPFFFVTGDDGTFTIKGLPPGKYTVEAWQETMPPQDLEITVAAKESKELNFEFKGKS